MTKINKNTSQVTQLESKLKRALADYQNLEKRTHSDRLKYIRLANQSLLTELLPILDDLKRAQAHLKDPGLDLVVNQFIELLLSQGLKPIPARGHVFDPQTMNCVEVVAGKKDQVINVRLSGYFFHDQVLRPAQVEVGSGHKS